MRTFSTVRTAIDMDLCNEWVDPAVNLLSVIAYRRKMWVLCCANKDDSCTRKRITARQEYNIRRCNCHKLGQSASSYDHSSAK